MREFSIGVVHYIQWNLSNRDTFRMEEYEGVLVLELYITYSGTSLIRTPLGWRNRSQNVREVS